MVGQDAVVILRRGDGFQPVHITHDALTDIQSPPRGDPDRLAQYAEVFAQIGATKIEAGEFAFDGRIWITGSDVRAWRCQRLETGYAAPSQYGSGGYQTRSRS
jgi:hypothetical protein